MLTRYSPSLALVLAATLAAGCTTVVKPGPNGSGSGTDARAAADGPPPADAPGTTADAPGATPDAPRDQALPPDLWRPPDIRRPMGRRDGRFGRLRDGRLIRPGSCKVTCDCRQGFTCRRGRCVIVLGRRIYCCVKPRCPTGKPCEDRSGARGTCP